MPGKEYTYNVSAEDKSKRLDVFLVEQLGESRSQIQRMVKEGRVLVDEKTPKKPGQLLSSTNEVTVREVTAKEKATEGKEKARKAKEVPTNIEIIVEEDEYLVISKPAGILVHPTDAEEPVTLASELVKKYPELKKVGEDPRRPGIVHRLDKEASGLLVIPRTQKMYKHLKKQFQARTVEKEYAVLVYGKIDTDHATIDFEIDRGKDGRMVSRPKTDKLALKNVTKILPGKDSVTEFWIEQAFINYTYLRVKIHSGRTHQIRVHMHAYAHPVVGDVLYFNKKIKRELGNKLGRLFLHAKKLSFEDLSGETKSFECEIPAALAACLKEVT